MNTIETRIQDLLLTKFNPTVLNILNESYTPHTSRLRNVTANGIPNAGRFFSVNLYSCL